MASWTKLQLPTPTNDLDKVANDIDRWGYGLLEAALCEPLLTKTRVRLLEQAAREPQFGLAFEDGAPLKNGAIFVTLMVRLGLKCLLRQMVVSIRGYGFCQIKGKNF